MLYTGDRESLAKLLLGHLEGIQDEPLGAVEDNPIKFGCTTWTIDEEVGYRIYHDKQTTVEGIIIGENGTRYITEAQREIFLWDENELFLTKEAAVAHRDKLIDEMSWEKLCEFVDQGLKTYPREWNDLLDKIRPLYKEMIKALDAE